MRSESRRRTKLISISMPSNLIDDFYDKAYFFNSIPAFVEFRIYNSNDLISPQSNNSKAIEDIKDVGRRLKAADTHQLIPIIKEIDSLIDTLNPISLNSKSSKRLKFKDPEGKRYAVDEFVVRVLPDLYDKSSDNARIAGLPLSQYLIKLCLGHPIYPSPSKIDARIISELGKVRGLLILYKMNVAESDMREISNLLDKVTDFINKSHE